jgi:hypothetical protein
MTDRSANSFKAAVMLSCYDALEAAGFTRYKKDAVDWPMSEGFHCWVGLNESLEGDHLDISPFIGVHVVPIMRLYTSLEGRKYQRTVATYANHMGRLVPRERIFRFDRATDVSQEAKRLAQLYVDVGLTYAVSIGSYETLLPLLRERVPMLGGYPERVATCLYQMGRLQEAFEFVEEFLMENTEYFSSFALPFLKLLRSDESGHIAN